MPLGSTTRTRSEPLTVPIVAVGVSVVALAVSIITLWLTQLRAGELAASPPKAWAGSISQRQTIIMIPLALSNTGAQGKVILDLRLVLLDEPDRPLDWVRTRPELRPEVGKPSFAAPIVLKGTSAAVHFVEFQRKPGRRPEAGSWAARIDAETMDSPGEWNPLLHFSWTITEEAAQDLRVFIARDNPQP